MQADILTDIVTDSQKIGTLVVVLDRARNLPNKKSTKQNPYCQVRLGKFCNKTKTDKRGGQTPRWDEELRFTAYDSADYYNLKISCFNDDKRSELIGEAYADLSNVIIPGGGQNDYWQELKFRGKYAGEVRIELTYYDSRPRVEKSAPRRQSNRDVSLDNENTFGGKPGNVKRRPLPSNPTGLPSTQEGHRLHASGPRQLGSAPPTIQNLRNQNSNYGRHSVDSRRPLPSHSGFESLIEDDQPRRNSQPISQSQPLPLPLSLPQSQFTYQESFDNSENSMDHDDHHSQISYSSGQQSVNYNSSVDAHWNDNNHSNHQLNHQENHPHRQSLHHSYSAPDAEHLHEEMPLRRSVTDFPQSNQHYSNHWDIEDPFGPDHPQALNKSYDQRSYHDDDHDDHQYMNPHEDQHEEYYDNSLQHGQDMMNDEPPPPPPNHNQYQNQNHRQSITFNSSPGYDSHQFEYEEQDDWKQKQQQQQQQHNTFYSNGHKVSRSEVALPTFRDQRQLYNNDERFSESNRLYDSDYETSQSSRHVQNHSVQPIQSSYQQNNQNFNSRRSMTFDDRYSSDLQSNEYITPNHSSMNNSHSYTRGGHRQSYSYGDNNYSPRGSVDSINSSPPTFSGSGLNHTPNRPHPLSQHQTISESPPEISSYQDVEIVKPLAISPNDRSSPWTSTRKAPGHSIPRKSVSPRPSMVDVNNDFTSPTFSPDSLSQYNPTIAEQTKAPAPIVDFHGNVVDPSDRLPETAWAPEPIKPKDEELPNLMSSPWGPDSESHRSTGRNIRVRVRDRVNGSRDMEIREPFKHSPLQSHHTSPINSSPHGASSRAMYHYKSSPPVAPLTTSIGNSPVVGMTTTSTSTSTPTRNRLTKKAPNKSSPTPIVSSQQPIRDVPLPISPASVGSNIHSSRFNTPQIPAKIPLDNGDSSRGSPHSSGIHFTNSGTEAMGDFNGSYGGINTAMRGMNLGDSPRRIGGRRLLGYGG